MTQSSLVFHSRTQLSLLRVVNELFVLIIKGQLVFALNYQNKNPPGQGPRGALILETFIGSTSKDPLRKGVIKAKPEVLAEFGRDKFT